MLGGTYLWSAPQDMEVGKRILESGLTSFPRLLRTR